MAVPALVVQDLTKVYKNGLAALKGIDLTVEQGDFFALLGPNGAGKSTTLGILSGLVQKTSGTAQVMGFDVSTQAFEARRYLGVVPQEFNFNQFEKVYDILITQAGYFGLTPHEVKADAERLLKQLDLWEKRDVQARMLSGGMKRRMLVAQALVHKPPVIVLDEPTAGVDVELRQTLWQFVSGLNKRGHTVLLTTHYLEEAEALCGRLAMLKAGRLLALAPTSQLLANCQSQTSYRSFGNGSCH